MEKLQKGMQQKLSHHFKGFICLFASLFLLMERKYIEINIVK